MDISKASNFERFIWDMVDQDGDKVAWLWQQIDEKGGFDLSGDRAWEKIEEDSGFVSGRSLHADRIETIRKVNKEYGVVIDPHTADGVKMAWRFREPRHPMIAIETALPAKFESTIVEALGEPPAAPGRIRGHREPAAALRRDGCRRRGAQGLHRRSDLRNRQSLFGTCGGRHGV